MQLKFRTKENIIIKYAILWLNLEARSGFWLIRSTNGAGINCRLDDFPIIGLSYETILIHSFLGYFRARYDTSLY